MKLYIKYCGGCNPVINRKKLVNDVVSKLKERTELEVEGEKADVGLIVGGCPVCCVNAEEIKAKASCFVVVGGDLVNCIQVPSQEQSDIIVQQLLQCHQETIDKAIRKGGVC